MRKKYIIIGILILALLVIIIIKSIFNINYM